MKMNVEFNNDSYLLKKVETITMDIDRRKTSLELAEHTRMLCEAKMSLVNGDLTVENGEAILDMMAAVMAKLNEYINKYDKIEIH